MEMKMAREEKCLVFAKGWNFFETLVVKLKEKCMEIAKNTKKIAKDDPRRVIHSLKMALALTLVSLFYYVRPLYDDFGVAGMWAVLTVVVVFEFSVGATISKGINRGCATLIAGALGVGAKHLAIHFGNKGEPIVLAFFVFLLASMSTFTRFFPRIKKRYDYGVLIFILTFSLVAISGYRVEVILTLAYQRLATILLGGATCMIVSIFVCPVWAGDDLHNLIAHNIVKLANSLEGFGEEYFKFSKNDMGMTSTKMGSKSFLQSHKSILASKSNEESLANFAKWEPCHGRFKLGHPWKQYLKIGAFTRQCAYQIEALTAFINNDPKAPTEFRRKIKESCTKMSIESSKTLRAMASSIETMTLPNSPEIHLKNSKEASEELQNTLKSMLFMKEDLLDATITSILINIVDIVEKLLEAVYELGKLAHFKAVEPTVSPETKSTVRLHRGIVNPVYDGDEDGEVVDHVDIVICVQGTPKHGSCIDVGEVIGLAKFANVNKIDSPPQITCM